MKNRWLTLLAILLLAGLLTLVMRDLMRENLVAPLLYLAWVAGLIWASIPQAAIWALFLLTTLVIALRSLIKKGPILRHRNPPATKPEERIESWLKLIRRTRQEDYFKWQLAQRLHKLTLETLAHDERTTLQEMRQRLSQNQLDAPPEVLAYLEAGMTSFSHFLEAQPRWRLKKQTSPLDLDPERVIQFLEDKVDYHPE
ncbi:MAG: hypothetical protein JW953_06000 [Anaerolineae bacterium]|nr:hypothetical protein [Anaerolineae bacterium]